MKAREVIDDAFAEARITGSGETSDAADMMLALSRLNTMIDSWSIEPSAALIPSLTTVPLTANVAVYTVGPSGGVVVPRPALPLPGSFVRFNGVDLAVRLIDQQDYNDIAYKPVAGWPAAMYWEQSIPNTTLTLFPVPYSSAMVLFLANAAAMLQFPDLDTDVPMGPGYRECLAMNLAVRISNAFSRPISNETRILAAGLKRQLKRRNVQIPTARINGALPSGNRAGGWYP